MTERAYERTPVGDIEVKTLPPALSFESSSEARDARGDMFWKNFQFLKENDLAMTTPVEMEIERPRMRFFVPADSTGRDLAETPDVHVEEVPTRTVVSIGLRGGYSARNVREGEERIHEWLSSRPEYHAAGPARAVYWNGPMVPAFLRRMEVHVPVERASGSARIVDVRGRSQPFSGTE